MRKMSRTRTGIVMEIKNNKACVMTSNGEFVNLKIKGNRPEIGEEYTGKSIIAMPCFKNIAVAASLVLFLLTGSAAYAYSIPVASITLSRPSVKVEVNRWNRIIKTVPLDNEAKEILSCVNINNKSLNDGLNTFVDEIKKKETAKESIKNNTDNKEAKENKNASDESQKIVVYVDNQKKSKDVNLSKFQEHADKSNLKVEITKNTDKGSNPQEKGKNGKDKSGKNKKTDNKDSNGNTPDNNSEKDNNNNNGNKK